MACSKISVIDIPEITNEIIQYCWNDFSTLHSCILVNRFWCRLAIPLLWEDPFSMKIPKNYRYIEVYLNDLDEDDKTKLNNYLILSPLNTLFNYPSFFKRLSTHKLFYSIKKWAEIINLPIQHYTFSKFIFQLLIKIFVKNDVNLHTFEIEFSHTFDNISSEYFEPIKQNPNFLCNIRNLSVNFDKKYSSSPSFIIFGGGYAQTYFNRNNRYFPKIPSFLKFLCSNCSLVSSLYFQFQNDIDTTVVEYVSQTINSRQIFYKILFNNISNLSLLKNSNWSNFLNTIIFHHVNFNNSTNLVYESFEQLNVLESIHLLYCSLNSNFIQQIINLSKPFKLKSLFMDKTLEIDLLQLLLQKCGIYLENIGFDFILNNQLEQQLFEIKNYCNKIKFISLLESDKNVYSKFSLIENIGENLNYLSINFHGFYGFFDDIITKFSSIILLNLGQVLPSKLEYLNLTLLINTNDFEVFLKNSQNTFINKFLIRNKIIDKNVKILPYIEKYIMKKRRVRYLAIEKRFNEKSYDSLSLKNRAKKFESYNIKVRNYDDLYIQMSQVCDFVSEMY
jgi:hypothetical protein